MKYLHVTNDHSLSKDCIGNYEIIIFMFVLCENIHITRHKNIHIDVLSDLTKDFIDLILLFTVQGMILASGMNINILRWNKNYFLKNTYVYFRKLIREIKQELLDCVTCLCS